MPGDIRELTAQIVILSFFLAIAGFFLFAWLIMLSYNGSIRKMSSHRRRVGEEEPSLKEISYWTAVTFVIFLVLIAALFGSFIASPILAGLLGDKYQGRLERYAEGVLR